MFDAAPSNRTRLSSHAVLAALTAQPLHPFLNFDARDLFRLDATFLAGYVGREPEWGPLGAITFARTYPRYVHELGRFETATEVFARCVEFVMGTLAYRAEQNDNHWNPEKAQRDGQEMFRRMWSLKILPAGRGLANLGTSAVRWKGAACLFNCGFQTTSSDPRYNPIDVLHGDEIALPAAQTMDYLMLGVGVGFDLRGAASFDAMRGAPVLAPETSGDDHRIEDTREGWVASVVRLCRAFRGVGTLPRAWDTTGLRKKGEPLKTFGGVSSGPAPLIELLRTLTGILFRCIGHCVDEEALTDIENVIGRCVVAGGVRRSSEIALGPMTGPGAAAFSALKDPEVLRELLVSQAAREAMIPIAAHYAGELTRLRAIQAGHSVLSPEFAQYQDEIDSASASRSAALYGDVPWAEIEGRINAHPLRAWRWASNNSVLAEVGADYSDLGPRIAANGEPGVLWLDNVRRYGRMADGDLTAARFVTHDTIPGLRPDPATGVNPCGEIGLESGELCNLVETFPSRHDSVADWHSSLKYAYLIAKAVSDVPLHNPATAAVQTANRRLGISVTGITEWYVRLGLDRMCEALDKGYRLLRSYDRLYSGWLGLPESIRLTTVKPSGTVSLLAGVEGGMRFPEAQFCARTIRIHDTSPLIDRLTDAGYRVEPDRYAPSTVVAYFPMQDTRVGRYASEVSIWEQAQLQAALQRWWSDNLVSATWTFRTTEARDIPRVLAAFDRQLKGMSALPIDGHSYVQPPYAPITEREHAEMSNTRPLDLTNLGTVRDREERFCEGGTCSLPA